ncbi:UGSC family (seleno)protein [Advenella kashmirensis]
MIELLNPTREAAGAATTYAQRPKSLKGKKVALIENTKFNSDNILKRIGEILIKDYGAESYKIFSKRYSSVPAHEEILQEVQADFDVMVAGIGDCGSCSSGTVLDGILLEMRNIPSASIITHLFKNTGKAMAKQWGNENYQFLIMEHPIANLPDHLSQERAELIAPQVVDMLLNPPVVVDSTNSSQKESENAH